MNETRKSKDNENTTGMVVLNKYNGSKNHNLQYYHTDTSRSSNIGSGRGKMKSNYI